LIVRLKVAIKGVNERALAATGYEAFGNSEIKASD
jgi:hypothetical protein